jgi:hypothetical protein
MKYVTAIAVPIVVLGSCKLAHAQYSDSVHHYMGIASTGTLNKTTKSQAFVLNNSVKFGLRKKSIAANLVSSWLYGEQQNNRTNNDFITTADFNLYKTFPRFYYWGLGNYTSSYSLKIIDQYQGGAGIAYNVFDKKDLWLNVSDGLMYESSNVLLADTANRYSTWRNSLRVSFRVVIQKTITLSATTFYQNSLSDRTDYIFRSNAAMNIKILKWLSMSATYTYNKYSRTNRENTILNYGLTIDKYF